MSISSVQPFFSILIPAFNSYEFIDSCIESVMAQTFSSWEIIAVDDGSTDGTSEKLDRWSNALGCKMHVEHIQNSGQVIARRTAIQLAHGFYCIVVDSDDRLRRDALEAIYSAAALHKESIIQYRYFLDDPGESRLSSDFPDEYRSSEVLSPLEYRRFILFHSEYNALWSKAIPRENLLSSFDYDYYASVNKGGDYLQMLLVLDSMRSAVLLDEPLYHYRIHGLSVSRTYRKDLVRSLSLLHEVTVDCVSRWGDDFLWRAVGSKRNDYQRLLLDNLVRSRLSFFKIVREIGHIAGSNVISDGGSDGFMPEGGFRLRIIRWCFRKKRCTLLACIVMAARIKLFMLSGR